MSLLQHALAHRSWCGEQEGGAPSNERLEFLGDAVLGLIVAGYTFDRFPDFAEGKLAKVRSAVVNARVLAQVAARLGVGEVLLLGRGEEGSGGRAKASILADAFEAILGAVYLDAGWEASRELVLRELGSPSSGPARNPTTSTTRAGCRKRPCATARGRPATWWWGRDRTTTGSTWPRSSSAGPVGVPARDAPRRTPNRRPHERPGKALPVPELPEVETLRQDLSREVVGRKIKAVAVSNGRSVRRHASAKHFRALLEGHSIKSVGRLGKYLLLTLDSGDTLVVHLGMSGQLLRVKSPKDPKPKHTHVIITFTQGGELRYVDPRTFGEMFVSTPPLKADGTPLSPVSGTAGGDGAAIRKAVPELAHLGFDPIEDLMSWDRFGALLHQHHGGVKALLMDQNFTAGIGNLYSDEMLYQAGLRYDRAADSLTATEVRRLYRAIVETLADAIKHRGSSLADEQYRDLFGELGDFQGSHQVYDREGQPCRRCRNTIVRVKAGGRSTFFCEHCQV